MLNMNKKRWDNLFISLCEAYHKKIVSYLYYTVGDMEAAKDLAQEVFTIVYKKIDELEDHENKAGFIYQTAKFVAANYKRKAFRKASIEQPIDENLVIDQADVYDMMQCIEDRKIEEEDYIEQVISSISKDKQHLYTLHYIQGKTYKEIAQKLGVSEVSIRMKYVRLRREIQHVVNQISKENFI